MKKFIKKYKNIITAGIIILIAILLVLVPVIMEKAKSNSEKTASILTGIVEKGAIATTLSGTGTLSAEESEDVAIPDGIVVTKYLVSNSDIVKMGDPLATVDRNSVIASMYSVWETISEIESDMADVYYDEASTNLTDKTGLTTTGEYEVLADEHRKYEEIAVNLSKMYVDGYIKASCDGMISGIDEDAAAKLMSSCDNMEYSVMLLGNDINFNINMLDQSSQESNSIFASTTIKTINPPSFEPVVIEPIPGIQYTISSDEISGSVDLSKPITGQKGEASEGDSIVLQITYTYDVPESPTKIDEVTITPIYYVSSGGGGKTPSGGGSIGGFGGISTESSEDLYSLDQTTLMSIIPMNYMTLTITVDELDVLSVNIGDEASVTVDAIPGTSYTGAVTSIDTTASNNGGNTKYTAEITIKREDKMLDGMNASSLIIVSEKENILTIPSKALSEENGLCVVYLGYDDKEKALINPVEVKTGVSDGETVEILSGLQEGQTYYYEYYDQYESEFTSERNTGLFSSNRKGGPNMISPGAI